MIALVRRAWVTRNRDLPTDVLPWVRFPTNRRETFTDLVAVCLLCCLGVTVVFRLWSADLSVPYSYAGDGLYSLRDGLTMIQTGWVQTTPRLGAPFGQSMYDYPMSTDNGNYVVMWAMSRVIGDPVTLINVFFLAGFVTTAIITYLCLRTLRCHRAAAVVGSVIFAFVPFRFLRGAHHLFLGVSYWVVAVGVVLALRAASGKALLGSSGSLLSRCWRALPIVAVCALCGSFGVYYAAFSCVTIALAGLLAAWAWRTVRPAIAAAQHVLIIAAATGLNLLPTLIYRWRHGPNPNAVHRSEFELDFYALRLSQMLSPVRGHLLPPLHWLGDHLTRGYSSEPTQFLGLVAATGVICMLVSVVGASFSGRPRLIHDPRSLLSLLVLIWLLIAMAGGLDWVANVLGFKLLRAWGRVSILIGFVSIAWLARWTTEQIATRGARWNRQRTVIVMVLVTGLALADQAPPSIVPKSSTNAASYQSDHQFFKTLEASRPAAAMVYQLPYRRFPEEPPVANSGDYDLLVPYIHTRTMRWSYGGMKGRAADWQENLQRLTTDQFVRVLSAVGYDGVLVDQAGYGDRGADLVANLRGVTQAEPTTSSDGRWTFLPIPAATKLMAEPVIAGLRDAFLSPMRLETSGCYQTEPDGTNLSRWCSRRASLTFTDPYPDTPSVLRARLVAGTGAGVVTVSVDGTATEYYVTHEGTEIELAFDARRTHLVTMTTTLPQMWALNDYRDLRFRMTQMTVLPADLSFGEAIAPPPTAG